MASYLESAVHEEDVDAVERSAQLIVDQLGTGPILLTGSCTHALELSALMANIQSGDEVIVPSYTFPSTANAFALRGAQVVFADCRHDSPHISAAEIARCLSPRTKAVVVMHYGGVACDLSEIQTVIEGRGIVLIEDAAHAVGAHYHGKPLGTFGRYGTFSFHSTKNLSCEHGGALLYPPEQDRLVEVLSSKGTNQLAARRAEVEFYEWVELGTASRMSGLHAALLLARLPHLAEITGRRLRIWRRYFESLTPLAGRGDVTLPRLPEGVQHNAHIFFITTRSPEDAAGLVRSLADRGIQAAFHYQPLHTSSFGRSVHSGESLPQAERYGRCLVRLPLWDGLTESEVDTVSSAVRSFFIGGKS